MMKKNVWAVLVAAMLGFSANGQYKKASFFNKSGRIYEFGTSVRLQGANRGLSAGIYATIGRERNEKKVHHWFELEVLSGYKYNYTTSGYTFTSPETRPVKVEGKMPAKVNLSYNLGIFLKENIVEKNTVLPFLMLKLGFDGALNLNKYGSYTTSPEGMIPYREPFNYLGGTLVAPGAGILYRVNEKSALRLSVAYDFILESEFRQKSETLFSPMESHPVVQFGLRFNMGESTK